MKERKERGEKSRGEEERGGEGRERNKKKEKRSGGTSCSFLYFNQNFLYIWLLFFDTVSFLGFHHLSSFLVSGFFLTVSDKHLNVGAPSEFNSPSSSFHPTPSGYYVPDDSSFSGVIILPGLSSEIQTQCQVSPWRAPSPVKLSVPNTAFIIPLPPTKTSPHVFSILWGMPPSTQVPKSETRVLLAFSLSSISLTCSTCYLEIPSTFLCFH